MAEPLYEPLNVAKKEFRLIRLSAQHTNVDAAAASVPTAVLCWDLCTALVYNHPRYIALSYCWGNAAPTETININGKDFAVRPNLYRFLIELARERRRDCWIFVDAICINQEDLDERSAQVGLMGDIYRYADEVIGWITFNDPARQAVLETICNALAAVPLEHRQTADYQGMWKRLSTAVGKLVVYSEYWSRLWIVQEILLAEKFTMRCLSIEIELSELLTIVPEHIQWPVALDADGRPLKPTFLATAGYAKHNEAARIAANSVMFRQLFHWQKSAGWELRAYRLLDLHEAVEFFSVQDCREDRDKIFGLLGIARSCIRPDYKMPMLDLYIAALYSCMLSRYLYFIVKEESDDMSSFSTQSRLFGLLGEVLFTALKLEPLSDVVILVSVAVCSRFTPPGILRDRQVRALFLRWFTMTQIDGFRGWGEEKRPELPRGSDETEASARQRYGEVFMSRYQEVLGPAQEDRVLAATGEDGRSMRASEWVRLVESICNDIQARSAPDIRHVAERLRPSNG